MEEGRRSLSTGSGGKKSRAGDMRVTQLLDSEVQVHSVCTPCIYTVESSK